METTSRRRSPGVAIVATLLLLALVYFGSAYFCFWRFTDAVKAHDRDRLAFWVDFRGVRVSLKEQWKARFSQTGATAESKTASKVDRIAAMLNAIAPSLVDQAIDAFVTPEGLVALLERPQAARDPTALVTEGGGKDGTRVDFSSLRHAWFSGLRDFVVEHEEVRLHFRFTKFRWRLLDVDLGLTSSK